MGVNSKILDEEICLFLGANCMLLLKSFIDPRVNH